MSFTLNAKRYVQFVVFFLFGFHRQFSAKICVEPPDTSTSSAVAAGVDELAGPPVILLSPASS